jgi:hypothetical protein
MSASGRAPASDQVRVSVLVEVDPSAAFRVFTEEIDQWWRRGVKYRIAGDRRGIIHLEPGPAAAFSNRSRPKAARG